MGVSKEGEIGLVLIRILLGMILGSFGSGVIGIFLRLSRTARRARRRPLVFFSGYVLVVGASLLPLIVLIVCLEQFDGGRTRVDELSFWAYFASFSSIIILSIRSELKWRRAIGLTKNDG